MTFDIGGAIVSVLRCPALHCQVLGGTDFDNVIVEIDASKKYGMIKSSNFQNYLLLFWPHHSAIMWRSQNSHSCPLFVTLKAYRHQPAAIYLKKK